MSLPVRARTLGITAVFLGGLISYLGGCSRSSQLPVAVPPATTPATAVITEIASSTGKTATFNAASMPTGAGAAPVLSAGIISAPPGTHLQPFNIFTTAPVDTVNIAVVGFTGFFSIPGDSLGVVTTSAVSQAVQLTGLLNTKPGTFTVMVSTQSGATVSAPASLTVLVDSAIGQSNGDLVKPDQTTVADRFGALLEGKFDSTDNINNNANKLVGEQSTGHREVVWDGVPAKFLNNDTFPSTFFNGPAHRAPGAPAGLILTTPGTGLRVSNTSFVDVEPSYASVFTFFTSPSTFAPVGSTITDCTFEVAGVAPPTPAFVHGMGVVFIGVDLPNTSSVEYFGLTGQSIAKVFAPPRLNNPAILANDGRSNPPFSFASFFDPNVRITRVRITSGEVAPARGVKDLNAGGLLDVAIVDDFYYSEPHQL